MTEGRNATPLLEFQDTCFRAIGREQDMPLTLQLRLVQRQLALIRFDRFQSIRPFADACCGLIHPERGETRFLGASWRHLDHHDRNAMRGMIGRAFETGAWLEYLSVAENVLIQQMHHTRRPRNELRAEAVALANRFGLPGLPTLPPPRLNADDLNRAALVRAFLGSPRLVILEQPVRENSDLLAPLIAAVLQARRRAAAVLWLTARTPPSPDLLRMCDQQLRVRQSGELEVMA